MMRDDQRRIFSSVMGVKARASMCFVNSCCSEYDMHKIVLKSSDVKNIFFYLQINLYIVINLLLFIK